MVLTSRKLTYCIVFAAALSLLACLGIRPCFARGDLKTSKPRYRAVIVEDAHKYNDQIVRDSQANDTSCVPQCVPQVLLPVFTGMLQPVSPAVSYRLSPRNVLPSRAPPQPLT